MGVHVLKKFSICWGGHSTLEVTWVFGQQLKTRNLSVRDFSPKRGSFSEKTKKGSNSENQTNFCQFFGENEKFGYIFLTKISLKK